MNRTSPALVLAVCLALVASTAAAQIGRGDRPAPGAKMGRSPVLATRGMIATSQPLASAAGLQVLRDGGNAVDAAIAAAAVLNVVEPMMCGIGGDLFALVYEADTGTLHGLNATGRAGSKASSAFMRDEGYENMPGSGIYAVTVPGALHGWEELRSRFGTRSLKDLLGPAIHYAEDGFPVSQIIANQWKAAEDKLNRHPAAAANYLVDGRAPRHGELFRSPDLAKTFRLIGDEGPDAFYKGSIANAIAEFIESEGGFVTAEDLASHTSSWVDPISTSLRRRHDLPDPAELPGVRRARDAQHPRRVRPRVAGPQLGGVSPPADRGEEAGLRGPGRLPRRPREGRGADRDADLEGLCGRAAQAHRPGRGRARGDPRHGRPDRDDLPHGRRRGPERRLAHLQHLLLVRLGTRRARHRHHAPEPGHGILSRAWAIRTSSPRGSARSTRTCRAWSSGTASPY